MAQVFSKEPLDFIMFFSSIVSLIKNPGQSPYASGSTFKDAFAHRLSQDLPHTVKVMNWGYWKHEVSNAYRERLEKIGLGLIESSEAMEALDKLLTGPLHQIGLMKAAQSFDVEGLNKSERIEVYP